MHQLRLYLWLVVVAGVGVEADLAHLILIETVDERDPPGIENGNKSVCPRDRILEKGTALRQRENLWKI